MKTKTAIAGALAALTLGATGASFATNSGNSNTGVTQTPPGATSTVEGEGGNHRGPGTAGQHGSQSENTTNVQGTTGTTGSMNNSSTQQGSNMNQQMPSNSPGAGTSTGSGGAAGTSGTVGGGSR